MGSNHPSIFKFINGIKDEQNRQEHAMSLIGAGVEANLSQPKYRKQEERIFKLVKKFDSDIQDGSFLIYIKTIANNVAFSTE